MTAAAPPPASALVVAAHPDDCDLACGGTVARWAQAGARVTLIVLTDGTKGSHDPDADAADLRAAREAEQRAGAAVLGIADVRFCRAVDGELRETPELVTTLAAAIRELRPAALVTHDPWRRYELHPDHIAAGRLACAALYVAREPRAQPALRAQGLEAWRPSTLYLFGAEEPDHVEDVTATFDLKVRAALCHRSQYVTSFGIVDPADPSAFVAALTAYFEQQGGDEVTLGERFKRVSLDPWAS